MKQLIAFFAIAAFIVVCGVLVYLNIREPHSPSPQAQGENIPWRSEMALQPSEPQTTPFAVEVAPVPSISATPTKEELELARRAMDDATKERPWVNGLGMKFVPVAGTHVLFSIWDTRVQDFETFVKVTGYNAISGMWSPAFE